MAQFVGKLSFSQNFRSVENADCRLRTRGKMQIECKMQTAD